MRPNVLRPKDRSLRGGKLVKLFTDYHALERVLSRISTANPPDVTVKRLSDALVQELDFTTANAWAYAKTAMTWSLRRNTDKGCPRPTRSRSCSSCRRISPRAAFPTFSHCRGRRYGRCRGNHQIVPLFRART